MSRVFQLTPSDLTKLVKIMNRDMIRAAKNLDFELAAKIRDRIAEIRGLKDK